MLGKPRRLAVLAEGCFTPLDAKTAAGVVRYRTGEVAAVIDSTRAGRTAQECIGTGGAIPVVADLESAAALGADSLLIGIAPQGGELPPAWRTMVKDALTRGWDVLAGLHVFLADDAELKPIAERHGARLIDARRPPRERPLSAARAAQLDALVVLTVGTDCNVGKMTAALELHAALADCGVRSAFVATGQTGIFIADHGAAIDAVPSDFAAGVVESLVLSAARDAEVVLVEGQGALNHPAYSGVTLSLLHGAAPAALVLCHQAGRERLRVASGIECDIPPLAQVIHDYERAAAWVAPSKVIGIALNTSGLVEARARAACEQATRETGLPSTDPLRLGAGPLVTAIQAARERRAAERSGVPAESRGGASPRRSTPEKGIRAPHA